jgi:hypothetical protein
MYLQVDGDADGEGDTEYDGDADAAIPRVTRAGNTNKDSANARAKSTERSASAKSGGSDPRSACRSSCWIRTSSLTLNNLLIEKRCHLRVDSQASSSPQRDICPVSKLSSRNKGPSVSIMLTIRQALPFSKCYFSITLCEPNSLPH